MRKGEGMGEGGAMLTWSLMFKFDWAAHPFLKLDRWHQA